MPTPYFSFFQPLLCVLPLFRYILRKFQSLPRFSLVQLLPQPQTLAAFAVASLTCLASQRVMLPLGGVARLSAMQFLKASAPHVAVGMASLAAVAAVTLKVERELMRDVRGLSRDKEA